MSEASAQIEQFLILSKGQKAKALETIIEQIISHPAIYVFGEFLAQANYNEMGQDNKHFRTLQLFAYDNYQKYKQAPQNYIELKPQQLKKLKMISIADLTIQNKILQYSDLMKQLDIKDLRELEDLMIDCIYNELLAGKLDQMNQQFHVLNSYGRDLRGTDVDAMVNKLEAWEKQLEEAQTMIEYQINGCNDNIIRNYERQLKHEYEMRERREKLLQDINEGNDEFGSGGPSMGKKRSGKQGESEGGIGDFLSGLRPGFLKKQ